MYIDSFISSLHFGGPVKPYNHTYNRKKTTLLACFSNFTTNHDPFVFEKSLVECNYSQVSRLSFDWKNPRVVIRTGGENQRVT